MFAMVIIIMLACMFVFAEDVHAAGLPYHDEEYRSADKETPAFPADNETIAFPILPEGGTIHDLQHLGGPAVVLSSISNMIKSYQPSIKGLEGKFMLFENTVIHVTAAEGQKEAAAKEKYHVKVTEIYRPKAAWLKIKFKDNFNLGNAKLIVSSTESAEAQTFSGDELRDDWNWYSPMFLGNRVRIQLQVAPETQRFEWDELIDKIIVGDSTIPEPVQKIYPSKQQSTKQSVTTTKEQVCNQDDRKPSQEKRVGRLTPLGCTVFIVDGGVYVSAGHCITTDIARQEVHFNVPPSKPTGDMEFSVLSDRYPVRVKSIACDGCYGNELPDGEDWAVFDLAPNTVTGLEAIVAQGGGFQINSTYMINGDPVERVRIDGFGFSRFPRTTSYTNQFAEGPFAGLSSTSTDTHAEVRHYTDTDGGSSGSPIIIVDGKKPTSFVLGVHNGGRCNPTDGVPNAGTGFSNTRLRESVKALLEKKHH